MQHATIKRPGGGHTPDPLKKTNEKQPRKKRLAASILLQVIAMLGIGVFVYSSAADWFARLNHNAEISGYVSAVVDTEPTKLTEELRIAKEYNSHMPAGMLRDPYTNPSLTPDEDSAYGLYEKLLKVTDKTGEGVAAIGNISYPRLGIGLPVYHGTTDEVLSKGAGHLYGSSLPVGGPSTHTVLTSHSGLVHASLFTNLPKAKIGDTFTVQTLGETHWYEVTNIETVLPEETERLTIVPGEDLTTLITCTPIGINSHRLLVTGNRIPAPVAHSGQTVLQGDGLYAGFPWWALIFFGASGAIAYLIFAPVKPKQKDRDRGSLESR